MAVQIVWDPQDSPELAETISWRVGPQPRVVLARPAPGVTTTRQLAVDLLIGLGKQFDALQREHLSGQTAWELVHLWLRAERTTHLVVLDAQRLGPPLRRAVTELGVPHTWEVHRHERPDPSCRLRPADLLAALPEPPRATDDRGLGDVDLPSASFLTFRAACRDLLTPQLFDRVDPVYVRAFDTTSRWLRSQPPASAPTHLGVTEQILALTTDTTSPQELIIRLRAAQAAYFCTGLLITVVPRPFNPETTSCEPRLDVPPVGTHPGVTARLRRLVTPRLAAAGALVASGLHPWQIANLRLADMSPSGCHVSVPAGTDQHARQLPRHAGGLIRAQLLHRRAHGARRSDRLFVGGDDRYLHGYEIAGLAHTAATIAHLWRPYDRFVPLWQQPPPTGFNIKLDQVRWSKISGQ